jgi:hypothetical protein
MWLGGIARLQPQPRAVGKAPADAGAFGRLACLLDTARAMSEQSTTPDLVELVRTTICSDIDEGRAAAERLAEERG